MAPTGEPLRVDIRTNEEKFVKYNAVIQPGQYQWLEGLYQQVAEKGRFGPFSATLPGTSGPRLRRGRINT